MITHISRTAQTRLRMTELLKETLLTTVGLQILLSQAHWQDREVNFDSLIAELDAYIDLFTEQITALGVVAMETTSHGLKQSAPSSQLPPFALSSIQAQITALADYLVPYARSLRSRIDSPTELGSADMANLSLNVTPAAAQQLKTLLELEAP